MNLTIPEYLATKVMESDGVMTKKELLIYNILEDIDTSSTQRALIIDGIAQKELKYSNGKYNCAECVKSDKYKEQRNNHYYCPCDYNQFIVNEVK
jgi:ferredoxin-thioredoxin reductase catalytic subunit